jgi:hypothetical protein
LTTTRSNSADEEPERDHERFALPCSLGDIPAPADLTPWLGQMLGRDADAILGVLKDDWSQIRHPALARIGQVILTYRPYVLARREGRWYLGLLRGDDDYFFRNVFYLESPADTESVQRILESYGFAEADLMAEFYRQFYGLTHAVGEPSSRFARPGEFETMEDYGWDWIIEAYDPGREWARAPVIYTISTGDCVILKADGQSVWGLYAEGRLAPCASSFERLLERLADSYERYEPLDFY